MKDYYVFVNKEGTLRIITKDNIISFEVGREYFKCPLFYSIKETIINYRKNSWIEFQ
jgi:hypothetical protein